MSKKLGLFGAMTMMAGINPATMDLLSEENIEKEIKKIKNQKPHKNRGTRIQPRTESKVGRNELCPASWSIGK